MNQQHFMFNTSLFTATVLLPCGPLLAQMVPGEACPMCEQCSMCVARIANLKTGLTGSMQMEDPVFAKAALIRLGLDYDDDDQIDAVEYITAIDLERARDRSRERLEDAALSSLHQSSLPSDEKQLSVEPIGWIRIALDFDNDNRADAYELIYNPELEQALMKSRNRLQQAGFDSSALSKTQEQQKRLRGKIVSLRTVKLRGLPQPHLIARVRTLPGQTVTVDLGPEQRLSQLNLHPGDPIMISGRPGTLDQQYILLADRIQSQDQFVRVNRPLQNVRAVRGDLEEQDLWQQQ